MNLFSTPKQEHSKINENANINTHTNRLFSHSKAEALLQRICHSVERHEIELTTIRCEIDSTHAQTRKDIETIQTAMSALKSQADQLNHRVQLAEESIRIPGLSPSSSSSKMLSVGEAVLANRRTLARTLNLVSQKANIDQMKELIESKTNSFQELVENMTNNNDLTSNDAIEKSNEAMSALVERVDVIANDMCNKVDKCLLKTLSSDAACIKNYAHFIRATQSKTDQLEAKTEEVRSQLLNTQNKIESFENQIQKVNLHLNNRVVTIDKFEEVNTTTMRSLMEEIKTKVNTCTLLEVERNNRQQSKEQFKVVEDDVKTLFSAHETLARHLTKRLDHLNHQLTEMKAMMEKQNDDNMMHPNYVTLDKFESELQKLKSIVDTTTCSQSLSKLQKRVHELEHDLCITKRKADLAAQFVGLCGKGGGDDDESVNI